MNNWNNYKNKEVMTELPEILPVEIYKSLYETESANNKELREQVATLELMATKLRDQRDEALRSVEELNTQLQTTEEAENSDVIEGETLDS